MFDVNKLNYKRGLLMLLFKLSSTGDLIYSRRYTYLGSAEWYNLTFDTVEK